MSGAVRSGTTTVTGAASTGQLTISSSPAPASLPNGSRWIQVDSANRKVAEWVTPS